MDLTSLISETAQDTVYRVLAEAYMESLKEITKMSDLINESKRKTSETIMDYRKKMIVPRRAIPIIDLSEEHLRTMYLNLRRLREDRPWIYQS